MNDVDQDMRVIKRNGEHEVIAFEFGNPEPVFETVEL